MKGQPMKPDTLTAQHHFDSPLGPMRLAASPQGLCGLWFEGDPHQPELGAVPVNGEHPLLQQTVRQLQAYFAGERQDFDLPLDLSRGTPFQQAAWQALRALPYGSTCSYRALSAAIGRPRAVRAVGAAIGRNPVSIIVPCHRVIGANGALTGYAGGLPRKQALLRLEGVLP
jgi:methylated-DNA-[protein]-cysteine S-methyltransferase